MENKEISISDSLKEKLSKHNQSQLLSFLPFIESNELKQQYLNQIEKADLDLMTNLFSLYKQDNKENKYDSHNIQFIDSQFPKGSIENEKEIKQKGFEDIAEGKVALLILAGGLGTRLGYQKAKGMYNIEMPSNKSLFEYLCNRFLASQLLAKERIKDKEYKESTLFIMTSQHNHKDMTSFFEEHNYFNLKKDNVVFFPQNEICGLDLNGQVINVLPNELYQAPDGKGGCFTAIKQHNIIKICKERNIEYINVTSIDNPLYKVLDPLFVGLVKAKGKCGKDQMGAKYVKKVDPNEKVGNFLVYKNHPMMLDYMEVPAELREMKKDNGDLVYNACNILDYLISVSFLDKVLNDESKFKELIMQFHILKKKFNICYYDEKENKIIYEKDANGLKFEIFFNSIFEFAEKEGLLLLEIDRNKEFTPVKNKEGEATNTPSITRKKMSNLFKNLYQQVGGSLLNDSEDKLLEFSFLINFEDETEETFFKKYPKIPKSIDMSKYEKGIYYEER